MRDISEVIKSYGVELKDVIPLILLFLFWWVFSLLTAKAKKIGNNTPAEDSPGLQERFLDVLATSHPKNEGVRPRPVGPDVYDAYQYPDTDYRKPGDHNIQGRPKPINPKWWAA
ncbi:MAG: hypothetical protein ACP5U1_13930 [Desulfomonilaceae bacterium]